MHRLVRDAVKYNDQEGISTSATLRKTYDLHRGNAADINLLLVAALRTARLEANPVLLSTRDHGRLNVSFPLASRFNYVIAHVSLPDGSDLLLDATEPLLPAGVLPERCLNQVGRLVLKDERSRWVDLKPSQRRVHYQQVALALTPEGTISGKVHEEHGGYQAASLRAELEKLGEPKYRSQFASQHTDWTLPKFTIAERTKLDKPVVLDYEFTQLADGNASAETLYLSPLAHFADQQNPFKYETRAYPVDFGMGHDETLLVSLALPPGYELAETPQAAVVDLPDGGGRYLYNVTSAGSTVNIISRMNLRKPVYGAEEYQHLREFYRLMLEKQSERLIIKKKS